MKRTNTLFSICLLIALLFAAQPSCAQKNLWKGVTKGLGAGAEKQSVPAAKQIVQAQEQAAKAAVKLPPSAPAVRVNPTVARFVNSNKRMLLDLQTAVGVPVRKAVENLHKWGAQPTKKPRKPVLLHQQAFMTKDFSEFVHQKKQEVPPIPFVPHVKYMYRGLGLPTDGAALRNILENGLLVKDVGRDNNNLRIAYASAGGMSVVKAIAAEPVINLTDSPATALHYAWRYKYKGILVIVSIKESVERGSIVTFRNDIPADQLQEVIALLSIDGVPTWCKVEAVGDAFRVIPYSSGQKASEVLGL